MPGLFDRWRSPPPVTTSEPAHVAPLRRAPPPPHHPLTVRVVRGDPYMPVGPVPGARVEVRPLPSGASGPAEPVARGTADRDGTLELLLPPGRYAVAARAGEDTKVVTLTLERAGRATIHLEPVRSDLWN